MILQVITLPETNSSHLKNDTWKTTVFLGRSELLFFGEGSCIPSSEKMDPSADGIFIWNPTAKQTVQFVGTYFHDISM